MRRTSSLLAGLYLVAAFACPSAGAATPSSPWLQPLGGASNNPVNWHESALSTSSVAKVRQIETIRDGSLSRGATCYGPSTPLITKSRIWTEYGKSLNEYDRSTGRAVRHIPLDSNVFSAVAMQGNVVVAYGTDCYSDHNPISDVEAFDATTGTGLWAWSGIGFGGIDLVHDYAVFSDVAAVGYQVEVRNLNTGQPVWTSAPSDFVPFKALVADNRVIAAGMTDTDSASYATLRAYSLNTGQVLWSDYGANFSSADPAGVFFADSPIGSSSRIYLSESLPDVVYPNFFTEVYSASTGKHLYQIPDNGNAQVAGRSSVYGVCSDDRSICSYRKATGKPLWSTTYKQTDPQDICCVSMALANGVLYLGNGQVLSGRTGKQLAKLWTTDNYDPPAPSVGFGEIADSVDSGGIELYGLPAKS